MHSIYITWWDFAGKDGTSGLIDMVTAVAETEASGIGKDQCESQRRKNERAEGGMQWSD